MATTDPVKCSCIKNSCTRVRGRQGENTRGYCQCHQNGTACTYLCTCGRGRFPCINSEHIEEEEDECVEDLPEDSDEEYDAEQERGEVLSVFYGDEEVRVSAADTLNTSLQDIAMEQAELNASMTTDEDEQAPVQRLTTALCKQTAMVNKAAPVTVQKSTGPKGKESSAKTDEDEQAPVQRPTTALRKRAAMVNKAAPVTVQKSTGPKEKQSSAKARRKAATKEVTSKISQLSTDGIQSLILKMAELYPDLVDMAMGPDPPEPPHETPTGGWCKCNNCREMPTTTEQVCCVKKEDEQCILISEAGPINQIVLSRQALEVAILNHNEYCIQNDDPSNNDALRHMAYRKFVLWKRGYLGPGNRVVIPSCVVWAIRDRYPSADGTYTGFKFSLMY